MPIPLPPDFWAKEKARLQAIFLPHLTNMAQAGVSLGAARLLQAGIAFDETGAHDQAAQWAREHTDALLDVVGTTTERGVGDRIATWLETPGADAGELERMLMPFLDGNVSRASNVGITEVTRAVAQGNLLAFTQAGVTAPPMWSDPTGERMYGPPAPHPNCRCDVGMVRHEGKLVVVWFTNKDDLVCRQEIETPWGTVMGCRALQGVCISTGEYLGKKVV